MAINSVLGCFISKEFQSINLLSCQYPRQSQGEWRVSSDWSALNMKWWQHAVYTWQQKSWVPVRNLYTTIRWGCVWWHGGVYTSQSSRFYCVHIRRWWEMMSRGVRMAPLSHIYPCCVHITTDWWGWVNSNSCKRRNDIRMHETGTWVVLQPQIKSLELVLGDKINNIKVT